MATKKKKAKKATKRAKRVPVLTEKQVADAAYEADKVWIYYRAPVPAEAPKEVAKVVVALPPAILVTKAAAIAAVKTGYAYGKPEKGK